MLGREIQYKASATAALFHASPADVRGIMGPIGSGKSVACVAEVLAKSLQQEPDSEGRRRTRWAIIRNTYPELKSTTIQTWKDWIPEEICPIVYDSPIRASMELKLDDGTILDMQVYFLALDKPKDVRRLLSLELTGVFINEARELDKTIIDAALSRTGRFPGKSYGAPITWTGLIMDTNPPDTDHWWYRMAEQEQPENWDFFRQPPALLKVNNPLTGLLQGYEANPEAENAEHQPLGFQYWMRLVEGSDPEWVNVHVCGEYGSVFDGKPVYGTTYTDLYHASPTPLGVFRGMPIQIGWDFGLTPSCVIGQLTPSGQLRILRELVCERGGIKQFTEDAVKPLIAHTFPGMSIASFGDPAGAQKAQADIELSCFSQLKSMGIPTIAAPTNDLIPRLDSVKNRLTRNIDGKPAFIIDPSCKMIRKGFIGGYKFERVQVTGEERYRDIPSKNKYSHVHDALQYLCSGVDHPKVNKTIRKAPPAPRGYAWA